MSSSYLARLPSICQYSLSPCPDETGRGAHLGIILLASSAVEGQRLPNCAVSNCVKLLCRRSVLPAFGEEEKVERGGLEAYERTMPIASSVANLLNRLTYSTVLLNTLCTSGRSMAFSRFSSRGGRTECQSASSSLPVPLTGSVLRK
jgi:hypothetical protein